MWELSEGVADEFKFATKHDIPIMYVNPDHYINKHRYKELMNEQIQRDSLEG